MKKIRFAIIGVAGYIAPRHIKAIKEINGDLVYAMDISDSVGILDSYFPECIFFLDEDIFFEQISKNNIEYLVVCTPNFLHFKSIFFGLNNNINVICEKPVVLNTSEAKKIIELEKIVSCKVYTILQLRIHPEMLKLQEYIANNNNEYFDVKLNYFTYRGDWYYKSWKSENEKSGGLCTNIGIHLFDLLIWLFEDVKSTMIIKNSISEAKGNLKFSKANVDWHLSIDKIIDNNYTNLNKSLRSIEVNGITFEFTEGFSDLHNKSYQQIIEGKGFNIHSTIGSIELVEKLR